MGNLAYLKCKFYGAKAKCGGRGVLDFGMLTKIASYVTGWTGILESL